MSPMLMNEEMCCETKEEISLSPSDPETPPADERDISINSEASGATDAAGVYFKGIEEDDGIPMISAVLPDVEKGNTNPLKAINTDYDIYNHLSPSQQAVLANVVHIPKWLLFIEYPFRVKDDKGEVLPEATGWSMDAAARGPLNIVGTYVGSCLLTLASLEAMNNNDNKIYGMKPSSLLAAVAGAVTLVAALIMPFIGALVDRSHHRKTMGILTAIIVVITTGFQISISETNWPVILCLEVIGGISLITHTTSVFSYMPDLSNSESVIVKYSTGFHTRKFLCMTVVSLSTAVFSVVTRVPGERAMNQIRLCRFASSVTFTIAFILLGYAWTFLFRKRAPLQQKMEGKSLMTSGLTSIKRSSRKIFACISNYRALKWLMISMLFSPEAGAGTVLSIATTLMLIHLKMSAMQLSIAVLLLQVFNIVGAYISKVICQRINPFVSYQIALGSFAVASLLTGLTTTSERIWLVYIYAAIWGISFGCFYATQRVLFCRLTPKGKQFEFMGFFMFFGNLLGWLPPIIFTVMNEKGVRMQYAFCVLPVFSAISLFFTFLMGSYEEAIESVEVMNDDSDFELPDDAYSASQSKTREMDGTSTEKDSITYDDGLSFTSNSGKLDLKGGCRRSPAYKGPTSLSNSDL